MLLTGKVAIITGASAGIGHAVAEDLAKNGAAVVVSARRANKLNELVKAIHANGGKALAVPADSSKESDIDTLISHAVDFSRNLGYAGRIDIAVVNAGRGLAGGLLASDAKQWHEVFAINVQGAATLMRKVGLIMVQQKSGDIVVLGSVAGHNISPYSGFYGGSKFAIGAIAEAFRREVASQKVRVTVIKPGVVISEFQGVAGYTQDNFFKVVEKFAPLLAPEDVARAITFVVSQPPHVHINDLMIRPTGQEYP
jgi:NADP-dependent 3-hydroxy acid dehydrogenase YdfG